ncbi:DUF6907 domain-containing protein [Streptomyces showdoensis]|uniref:Uncharacterized protein n=1 Tax=Streptomyces showdoensis TaxID=68268 RepID=A0A2P2GS49_STREW|nr:hypothetical protein [Streptomyces showdoensis]KKZ74332.1 hypothetical protein VO63_07750 [Streptomyces showdoensis]
MSDRDPLQGVPDELKDWHQGALDGDPAVCAAPQPMQPGYPCIHSTGFHELHRDVYGRTWPNRPEEPLYVARKAPVVDGMVTVETGDHGPVHVPEPSWCVGLHPAESFQVDIEHQGVETVAAIPTLCHGIVPALGVSLVQRPFSPTAPQVHAVVNMAEDFHAFSSTGLDIAAGLLVDHAAELRHMARQLAALEVQS